MDKVLKKSVIIVTVIAASGLPANGEDVLPCRPEIHGTIRAKYEYAPPIDRGRFEIRNARLNVDGKILPVVSYKTEVDLSYEGAIKMLDAYIRVRPRKSVDFTIGQMRVPFTIDAHRSPHLQYFPNRSFIAKQVGDVRDVGATMAWTCSGTYPIILEGGIFNGSGLTDQKDFWTSDYCFSLKAQTMIAHRFNITLSGQKARNNDTNVYMYNAGGYYQSDRWHIEGEYLRKYYQGNVSTPVNAFDFFMAYRLPLKRYFSGMSFLGRYDYMSDHSNGKKNDAGLLKIDDLERHRLTGGITLSMGTNNLQADLRMNYEQYFYRKDVIPSISDQNKIVMEFVCHF